MIIGLLLGAFIWFPLGFILFGILNNANKIENVRVKPIKVYDDYEKRERYKCPNCGKYLINEEYFCHWPECGQALDWSE